MAKGKRIKTVEQMLKNKPPDCACEICRNNCHIPCWGTPDQIQRLIDSGHGDRLSSDYLPMHNGARVWLIQPAAKTYETKNAPFIALEYIQAGGCTFWNLDGLQLCALHDQGLKPLEGTMSHHHPHFSNGDWIRDWIAFQWDTDEGRAVVASWKAKYQPETA